MFSAIYLFAQQAEPLIQRLDQATRVKVLLALTAIVALGVAAIIVIWLAGRAVRRYSNHAPNRRVQPIDPDDWADKPLTPPLDGPAPHDDS